MDAPAATQSSFHRTIHRPIPIRLHYNGHPIFDRPQAHAERLRSCRFTIITDPAMPPSILEGQVNNSMIYARGAFSQIHYGRLLHKDQPIEVAIRCIMDRSNAHLVKKEHQILTMLQRSEDEEKCYFPISYGHAEEFHSSIFHIEQWAPYNLAEYIQYKSEILSRKIAKGESPVSAPPIPILVVHSIAHHLLKGLDFLYRQNIVHGDISPDNIAFTSQHTGSLKILDFGSAEQLEIAPGASNATPITELKKKGKVFYRAPEMIKEEPFDMAVDLFAAGVIFFRLCGQKELFPIRCNAADLKVYHRNLPCMDEYNVTQVPLSLKFKLDSLPAIEGKESDSSTTSRRKAKLRIVLENLLKQEGYQRGTPAAALQFYFPEESLSIPLDP